MTRKASRSRIAGSSTLVRALALVPVAFERLEARVPTLRHELALAEIVSSMRLAGHRFSRDEVGTLAERGIAPHGRSLAACNALADYAAANEFVANLSRTGRGRAWLQTREIVALHALATRRTLDARPGSWRAETLVARGDGAVAPAPWAIPREIARYVDRFALGPPAAPEELAPWLAAALRGFERIAPFSNANGRVERLVLAILLRRLRLPPLVLRTTAQGARFRRARASAVGGDLEPLATFLAITLVRTAEAAFDVSGGEDDGGGDHGEASLALVPLTSLAPDAELTALYKAAERGRLRAVHRGRQVLSTARWLTEYRRSRSAAGRPPKIPPRVEKCDTAQGANEVP